MSAVHENEDQSTSGRLQDKQFDASIVAGVDDKRWSSSAAWGDLVAYYIEGISLLANSGQRLAWNAFAPVFPLAVFIGRFSIRFALFGIAQCFEAGGSKPRQTPQIICDGL